MTRAETFVQRPRVQWYRAHRAQARSGELVDYPDVYRLAGRSTADVETFSPRDTTR
jgi:hypothetical protein